MLSFKRSLLEMRARKTLKWIRWRRRWSEEIEKVALLVRRSSSFDSECRADVVMEVFDWEGGWLQLRHSVLDLRMENGSSDVILYNASSRTAMAG